MRRRDRRQRDKRHLTRGLGRTVFLPLLSNWHILASIYMVRSSSNLGEACTEAEVRS